MADLGKPEKKWDVPAPVPVKAPTPVKVPVPA